ncbi:MAG: hypothetical protein IJ520_05150 [Synergistaceae bacterium]|nr:hypothetical protein [Synergistaceae bacterium]MBR1602889.1 hypothetical protein [Synergistaceae bacterium]
MRAVNPEERVVKFRFFQVLKFDLSGRQVLIFNIFQHAEAAISEGGLIIGRVAGGAFLSKGDDKGRWRGFMNLTSANNNFWKFN